MYRWFIALRYLCARFITFAALLVVASGVALLTVILSVMEGFRTDLEDRIRGTSADLKVESRSLVGLKDADVLAAKIEAIPGVRAASPYVEMLAMHRPEGSPEQFQFFLQGMDLVKEGKTGAINVYLRMARDSALRGSEPDGGRGAGPRMPRVALQPVEVEALLSREWLEAGLRGQDREARPAGLARPILVGYEAAKHFGFTPGRSVRLTSYSPVASRAVEGDFVVAGVFLSRDYIFDSRTVLLRLDDCVDFLELRDPESGRPAVSGVRVTLEPGAPLAEAAARVAEAAAGGGRVRVKTWRQEKASLLRAVRIEKTVVGIMLGVLILFTGFMIFIVLTVQVVEKTRDLGILQSLGSSSWGIAGIYLLIGTSVCLVGTVLGAFLGVAFSLSINTIQRWLYVLVGFELFPRSVYYIDHIPVRIEPVDLLLIIAPMVLASAVGSVVPAYRAARKDPVVALRYE